MKEKGERKLERFPGLFAVEEPGETLELALAFFLHRGEKCACVDEIESAAQRIARRHEVDRGRDRSPRGDHVLRPRVHAEPFEKRIAAQGHAHRKEWRTG